MSQSNRHSLEPGALGAARLIAWSGRWLLIYLLAMLVMWHIGIEAKYGNPTPFYALFWPLFPGPLTPILAVLAMAAAYYLVRRTFLETQAPVRRPLLRVLFAGFVLSLLFGLAAGGDHLAINLVSLLPHLQVIVLFVVGLQLWAYVEKRDWLATARGRRLAWALGAVVLFASLFAGSMAALRGGFDGIADAYSRHQLEFSGDIGMGGSIRGLFGDYVSLHPHLSVHSKVHPPGPIALLWLFSYIVGRGALGLSLMTIVFGSLAVIPLFFWTRDLFGQRCAWTITLLYALMPSVVLFTATSADILFMPFTVTTLFLFWRALHRPSAKYAVAAGVGYACMALLKFPLIGVGAFFGIVGLWRLTTAEHRRGVVQTAVVMLASFLAVQVAVWAWSGFDIITTFWLSLEQFRTDQYYLDLMSPRYPAWTWRFLNPLAWVYFAGIPVTLLFLKRLRRPEPDTRALFIVFGLTLLALNFLYLARGEGERSALYIFPFIAVPAGHLLDAFRRHEGSINPQAGAYAFLAFQTWLTESLFYMYW